MRVDGGVRDGSGDGDVVGTGSAGTLARSGAAAVRGTRWRFLSMSSASSSRRGARRPFVRQQGRPDVEQAGRADHGRAHHGGGTGGTGQDSCRRPGRRSQSGDGPPWLDRCAHAHVQQPWPQHDHGGGDAHRHPEHASRSASRHHDGARHELPRQRIRRRRDPQRHQPGPTRRPPVSGLDAGHRVGRDAGDRPGQSLGKHGRPLS